jgi:hypothetical protein
MPPRIAIGCLPLLVAFYKVVSSGNSTARSIMNVQKRFEKILWTIEKAGCVNSRLLS